MEVKLRSKMSIDLRFPTGMDRSKKDYLLSGGNVTKFKKWPDVFYGWFP